MLPAALKKAPRLLLQPSDLSKAARPATGSRQSISYLWPTPTGSPHTCKSVPVHKRTDTLYSGGRADQRAHGHTECHRSQPTRTFTHLVERGRPRPRAGLGVYVRFEGLTRMFKGLRANDTPRQTPLRPKRRPPRPQPPVFSIFRRGGLHFGHHTTSNRDLTATKRTGEMASLEPRHAGDTPTASL